MNQLAENIHLAEQIGLAPTDYEAGYENILGFGKSKKERRDKRAANKKKRIEKRKKRGGSRISMLWRGVVKVAAAAPRNGFLLILKMNMANAAIRLYPALLTDAQLKQGKFKLDNAKKAKKVYANVEKLFVQRLKGNKSSLQNAIKVGAKKKAAKLKSADGYMYTVGAIVAAGLSVLAAVLGMLNKGGVDKNPYEEGNAPASFDKTASVDTIPINKQDVKTAQIEVIENDPNLTDAEKEEAIAAIEGSDGDIGLRDEDAGIPMWGKITIGVGAAAILGLGIWAIVKYKKK